MWLRLRAALFRSRVERELADELAFHVEMQTRKNLEAGMSEAEARRAARLQFGRESAVREDCRDERRIHPVETLRQDIRYALRGFRRAPLFALTVVATIGLGLGVNTAVFTIFNAYALRPLAVRDPWSLYQLSWLNRAGKEHALFTWRQYDELQAGNPAFSELHAARGLPVRVNGRQCFAELVTGNYFRMLGVDALLGRTLTPEDSAVPGRNAVMVLSTAAWRNLFAADPNILGRKLFVRGYPFQVVGVAREGFAGLGEQPRDLWIPLSMYSEVAEGADVAGPQSPALLNIVVRLRPGVGERQARALLTPSIGRLMPQLPEADRAVGAGLQSRATSVHISPEGFTVLLPIFSAFGLVLLIACANVSNMMLARAMARQREIGIRLSLGAARARLIRQLLTESIMLALPGAVAGLFICQAMLGAGVRLMYATLPAEFVEFVRVAPLNPDVRVFVFMTAAAVLSALFFGLAPAIQATRTSVVQAARGDFGHEFRPQRLRNALVIVQIAVCSLLLICSGVLLDGANRIHDLNIGFRTHDVVWIELLDKWRDRVLTQLDREPLVNTLAATAAVPLEAGLPSAKISVGDGKLADSSYDYVSPEFFDVLGVSIIRGRNFSKEEALAGAPVAIVSETVARRLWPDSDAPGQSLRLLPDPRSSLSGRTPLRDLVVRVVGVARDMNTGLVEDYTSRTLIYFPTHPRAAGTVLIMRVNGDPETARQSIDRALAAAAPGAVDRIHRMQELVAGRVYPFRVTYWVSAALGILALLLTVSGIYGVISYLVAQRVREMGIRMALGATARSIVGMVLKQLLRLAAVGIGIGGALALGASRAFASALVMMNAFDATAFLSGILLVLAACLAAAFVPSLRAARIDPMTTLRHD
jgi:predicted permease